MHLRLIARLIHINWVLVYHGLDEIVLKTRLFRPVRFLVYLSPSVWFRRIREPRGVRIRHMLEELGPIFVKFGQTLSTRKDLLPEDIADELVKLQDKVPPFPVMTARQIIESELKKPIDEVFATFDETPLASASIAQVHTATLPTGEPVIVKVLRPDIDKKILSDMGLLYELAHFAERFWPEARRLRPVEVVAEFEKTLLDELDLMREAANASKLRKNFENSSILFIPQVHWPLTRRKIMVMERIEGIPIGNIEQLRAAGCDFKLMAEYGVEIFFTQVFRDNFFHADMHPGNIFVQPPAKYLAVDFGIVGTLSRSDQHYLAENFLAFFKRDYRRVAEMHVASGWVPPTTRVEELEAAIRAVCEPIFEKPLKEISFGHLLLRLFQTARRFDMAVQPQLVLLQKTLLNIEGLGRELYPELDLWQTAKPFLEKWFRERMGPKAKLDHLLQQLPDIAEQWPELPSLLHKVLQDTAQGRLHIHTDHPGIDELRREIRRNHRQTLWTIIGGLSMMSLALLWALSHWGY